jgi:hypothetical protein
MALAVGALAGETGYIVGDNEELYGTRLNINKSSREATERVFKPDGTVECIRSWVGDKWGGRYLITGKWYDSQGNIFYRYHWVENRRTGLEAYSLGKISNSGNTLEAMRDHSAYPTEIDPKHPFYEKFTRK